MFAKPTNIDVCSSLSDILVYVFFFVKVFANIRLVVIFSTSSKKRKHNLIGIIDYAFLEISDKIILKYFWILRIPKLVALHQCHK